MSDARPQVESAQSSTFTPARLLLVDIDEPLPTVPSTDPATGRRYQRALSVVRLHKHPLGLVEMALPEEGLSERDHAHLVWSALEGGIAQHLRDDGLPVATELREDGLRWTELPLCLQTLARLLAEPPLASVVVPTREHADRLARCLDSLLSLDYPRYEVIVVDNAPSTDATAQLIASMAHRDGQVPLYFREDRLGVSFARNRGLWEAKGEIVAFADDDMWVDPGWLSHLVAGFRRLDNVACVTGNILPMEMETQAQSWLEQFGGFSKGFARQVWDLGEYRVSHPLYPYTSGRFGSAGNCAFRVEALRKIGGFDPALGPGSPARAGGELALFFTTIARGYRLIYEPAAMVRHPHLRDYAALRNLMYAYGIGLTAYLTKCVVDDPRRLLDLLCRAPYGLWFTLSSRSPKNRGKATDYPPELTRLELKGMAYGPLAYLRGRWGGRTQMSSPGRRRQA